MELKDYITIGIGILGVCTGIAGFIFGIYQHRKNQQLEREKLELERSREEKRELKEKIVEEQGKKKKKSDVEIYCDHIGRKFKYLDFTGLNAILQKPLLLEEIYVKLRAKKSYKLADYLTIEDFKILEKEQAGTKDESKKLEVKGSTATDEDFVTIFKGLHIESTKNREPLKMVILGQPGSGKTTLMKWIALQNACSNGNIFSHFIPIFIPLKDLGREPGETFRKKNIRDLTLNRLKRENLSTSFINEYFEENRLIFLLDGLDEVADENIRKEVIQWIQNQNIRKNSLLVTSRFSGLHEAKGLKFHDAIPVFSIRDFDIADIERFLENWYRNIEVAVAGNVDKKDEEQAIADGKHKYKDLMNIIKNDSYKNLRQLAVNPLLLTIIAIVHRTRAILPKERHKLYDECLKVMIELWNVANKKLNVSFSVENSLDNLAKIASFLMKENRREIELPEIKKLLPAEIEGQSLGFFLNEMVLKAGLLYESESKYGFLHLTLQEYLTACYFAGGEDQNQILAYREKDYWNETFKLFVNIGNSRRFFQEIIDNLEKKDYWQQMQLWDDCLSDVVVAETQKESEIKFAEKILDILPKIEYKERNEELIIQLYVHYPLYKHAKMFAKEGWHLFHYAKHPFVQSVGSSILNRAGKNDQSALIEEIKQRVNSFEKQENKNKKQLLNFLYQNNNSFILLIAARRNLSDFDFVLKKLKSSNPFIKFMNLRDFRELLDVRYFVNILYIRFILDIQDIQVVFLSILKILGFIDSWDLRDIRDLVDIWNANNTVDISNFSSPVEFLDIHDLHDFRDLRSIQELRDARNICTQYVNKYNTIIRECNKKIEDWVDMLAEKLYSIPDKKLLGYFPGTTLKELQEFRESKGKNV